MHNSQQHAFSSSSAPPNKASKLGWQIGTTSAVIAVYLAVNTAISYVTDDDNGVHHKDGPVAPQANITTRVYFDIEIDGHETGRIVMGLYGGMFSSNSCNSKHIRFLNN
jgi:hypothetical protein